MDKVLAFLLRMFSGEGSVGAQVATEIQAGLAPVSRYVRRASLGIAFILVSAFTWLGGVVGTILALFFYLANLHSYVIPALLTIVASWIIALIFLALGFYLLRKPR